MIALNGIKMILSSLKNLKPLVCLLCSDSNWFSVLACVLQTNTSTAVVKPERTGQTLAFNKGKSVSNGIQKHT